MVGIGVGRRAEEKPQKPFLPAKTSVRTIWHTARRAVWQILKRLDLACGVTKLQNGNLLHRAIMYHFD